MDKKEPATERMKKNIPIANTTDKKIQENIRKHSGMKSEEISKRLKELNKEWSIERALELSMASIAMIGISLAVFVSPYWLFLSLLTLFFSIENALQGWCPPVAVFKYYKMRTREEIESEKYALKAIKGDFAEAYKKPVSADYAFDETSQVY